MRKAKPKRKNQPHPQNIDDTAFDIITGIIGIVAAIALGIIFTLILFGAPLG